MLLASMLALSKRMELRVQTTMVFYMGGLVQNANTDMLMIDHSAVNDPDNQIQRAGDGIIQKRQFANAELHQYVEDRRAGESELL